VTLFPSTISGRLAGGYAAMLAFMAAMIAVAWVQLHTLGASSRHLTDTLAAREREARQWQALLGRDALAANAMLVTSDPDKLKPLLNDMTANARHIAQLQASHANANDEAALAERVAKAHARHAAATRDFLQAAGSGSSDFMRSEFNDKYLPSLRDHQAVLEELAQRQHRRMDQGRSAANAELALGIRILLAVGALACAVGSVLAWRLARSIRSALAEAIRVANAVSDGNLAARSRLAAQGELKQLFDAQQRMCERLMGTLASIQDSADAVQLASHEIATGNNDLSARTEQQAGTLQQTTSSMEQMTEAVCANAATAAEASQLAESASHNAVQRGEQMNELVATMQEMATSSGKIAEITGVIDGIAFQTNILALNAAVEAARAGEHGRGFAVVADEVRTLAQRSANAAREIRDLIQESVKRVDSGATLVTAAGDAIGELVGSVQRVSAMLRQVAQSTGEQSRELGGIHHSVSALDHMTQQNAALVEQSAAAAGSLKDQADRLKEAVAVFRFA